MSQPPPQEFLISADLANQTLAALLRKWLPGQTWSQVRKLVAGRRVQLNGELWLDDARRLKVGDRVELLSRPSKEPVAESGIVLRHVEEHLVVVEKPSGI